MSLPSDFMFGVFALVRGDTTPMQVRGGTTLHAAMEELLDLKYKQRNVGFRVRNHKAAGTAHLERRGWCDVVNPLGDIVECEYWVAPKSSAALEVAR